MIKKSLYLFPFLLYLSCTSAMERARKNASDSFCPNFGAVAESSIPAKAIFEDPTSKSTKVFIKDTSGLPIPVEKSILTEAKNISKREQMTSFLLQYKSACGSDSFPPYFEQIAYVKKYRQQQEQAKIQQKSEDLAKARAMSGAEMANQMDKDGKTPLMQAAERGQPEVVAELLKHNADPGLANVRGETALSLAKQKLASPPPTPIEKLLKEEIGVESKQAAAIAAEIEGNGLGKQRNYEKVIALLEKAQQKPKPDPKPKPKRKIPALQLVKDDCGKGLSVSKGPHDGRFTLGLGKRRLMFGYPMPLSTSHFVVRVGKNFASNYRGFGCQALYLRGTLEKVNIGKPFTEIRYEFDRVEIHQRLIPVNSAFQHVTNASDAQYFRIEYELINKSEKSRDIGLLLLIDTMIEDTDSHLIAADGKRVRLATSYGRGKIPKTLRFFGTANQKASLTGEIALQKNRVVVPDEVHIGNWPLFHSVVWNIKTAAKKFRDTAVVLKWWARKVGGGQNRILTTHYGLAKKERGKLSSLFHSGSGKRPIPVTYRIGSYRIYSKFRKTLKSYIQSIDKSKVVGVVIDGYADALGNSKYNLDLSYKRALVAKEYLIRLGIPAAIILPKAWGETYASQSRRHQNKGNRIDRRINIKFYFQDGSANTVNSSRETFHDYEDSEDEPPLELDDGWQDEDDANDSQSTKEHA